MIRLRPSPLAQVFPLLFVLLWFGVTHATAADRLPIVFVHGSSGSASQFETQVMRFTSNGYRQELLFVYEYDTSVPFTQNGAQVVAGLDAFIDAVRSRTGSSQVNLAAHSLGTTVSTTYLNGFPGGAAKVARYVNIDGRSMPELPGGVPTLGIWGEWNSGGLYARQPGLTQIGPNPQDNYHFPEKGHTEVTTSAEAFSLMYRFFTGVAPQTTDVVPERPSQLTIAGRAVIFPENSGFAGATLQLWRINENSGQRIGLRPLLTQTLDASGAFGPIPVNGRTLYELALVRPDGSVHHFYQPRFVRSNHFVRLNSSRPGVGLDAVVPKSPNHSVLTLTRQKEFWGDQGHLNDRLEINGAELLTAQVSPRRGVTIGVYAYDDGLDGQSDLGKGELFPFNTITFISAGDLFIPASPNGRGVVRLSLRNRGGAERTQLNVPNWPSSTDRISVQFRDYSQAHYEYDDYLRNQLLCELKERLPRAKVECDR
ncbi:alpha/beta hydrolase [Stutzerimonas azotifigens]|uniref:Alpha/beta hydrolase n=1 Tax=Stutzerimonas azotifigens TaxID=291995 RepID=A0ABR5YY81_9GAMM|nr:alpha/beta hydrolase [Stutzerimonas azotifigens]MBA1272902.1 alpha/beta hydrolase [Stutzerimonas azotifigens]